MNEFFTTILAIFYKGLRWLFALSAIWVLVTFVQWNLEDRPPMKEIISWQLQVIKNTIGLND